MTPKDDVKGDQSPSAGQEDVSAASSTATADVNASASSTEDGSREKQHEDSIPYSRFKEKVDEVDSLKERLTALEKERENAPFDWGFSFDNSSSEQDTSQRPSQSDQPAPFSPDQIEEDLREKIADRPFQTLWPMMMEAARQQIRAERTQEDKLRGIPDFKQYEDQFYNVPDDLVAQAQANPHLVKYLLAKHRATLQGKPAPPPPQSPDNGNSISTTGTTGTTRIETESQSQQGNAMDELREKYRKEGEQAILRQLRETGALAAESAASLSTSDTDKPELSDSGKLLMGKLGIGDTDAVARRLERYMKGK